MGESRQPWIETRSGRKFNISKPDFVLDDIVWGLSNACRYAGQCSEFYSVAEHSVLVQNIMDMEFPDADGAEGLLHDGIEAYLGDVPKPFKQLLPDWREIEDDLDTQLRYRFWLPLYKTIECRLADQAALILESRVLMHSKGDNMIQWVDAEAVELADRVSKMLMIHCWSPYKARLELWEALKRDPATFKA